MAEASNQQMETRVQMDDTVGGEDLDVPHMDEGLLAAIRSSSGERAASESAESTSESSSYCSANITDTAGGLNMDDRHMEDGNSLNESNNARGERAAEQTEDDTSVVADLRPLLALLALQSMRQTRDNDSEPRRAGNFTNEVDEFMPVMHRYVKNIEGKELPAVMEALFREIVSDWNSFLQPEQGVRGTSAIISSNINEDIKMFILWLVVRGAQWPEDIKKWTQEWLKRWNLFIQARAGETLVTRVNLFLTIVGFIFYIVDLVSDIATAIFFASNGQWWQVIVTLAIVYGAVIFYTIVKWRNGLIHCTGATNRLCYVLSLLVNWPDVQFYRALCRVEWQLHKSPVKNARLVLEWHKKRNNVAILKFTEGVWEACPQAILQLYLLVPDLYGAWTWTDYFRIAGASVSLCTAGAALVNWEKFNRYSTNTNLPLSELVVLYVWAVPVTASRLLSLGLLLSVHLYWALAGVALHLVLRGVYYCRTVVVPRKLNDVISMCLNTLPFCLSPFVVAYSIKYRRVAHAIHFLGNTAATVVWAVGTTLVCTHPALSIAIICVNAVMFVVGLVGMELHVMQWPDSYS